MKTKSVAAVIAAAASVWLGSASNAAYNNNFEVDTTGSWNVNNNNQGTNDANFFFDYSTAGIPAAPSGTGTRGLRLRTNVGPNAPAGTLPGISVSPTGQSFVGDHTVTFDWWGNYLGPLDLGAVGSTQLTNFGVLSSGTAYNGAGAADGVFFAATSDGQNASDYRAYSSERNVGYQLPTVTPEDSHATYLAGSRNSSDTDYHVPFPGGKTAPGSQAAIGSQSAATPLGAAGFQWNQVRIDVVGDLVTWTVNGTQLITVDKSNFTTPTGGTNILLGMSDINNTTNVTDPNFADLQFSVIDNLVVVPEPGSLALLGLSGLALAARRRRA
jgi:hypothetical protein